VIRGALGDGGAFSVFADQLLSTELPDLPDPARASTVAFVIRRANQVPSPLRVGITVLSIGVGAGHRLFDVERTCSFLRRTRLPFVGELARMVRSLGFAYIWETWPDTSPSGAPA
jgi:hypothetical protein